jgi:flagellar biosynthetic protein FliR
MPDESQLKFLFDHWMSSFILVFARVLAFAHIGPVLSQSIIPVIVRYGLSLFFTILITTVVPSAPYDMSKHNYLLSIFINLLAGTFIGFMMRLVLDVLISAGEIMDKQFGLEAQALFDPNSANSTATMSGLLRTLGLVLFMYCGGFEAALITFTKSFEIFPLAATDFASFNIDANQVIALTGNVVVFATIGASPVIITILFTDIVLALMSRAAQQINPFSLSFSIKPIIGLTVFILTLPFLRERLVKVFMQGVSIF